MWITAILIFAFMLLWQGVASHAGPLEDCGQAQDIERRIHGCTNRIHQFPRDATAFFNRGSAYLSKGDLDRAIADNTSVIQIDPAYATAYYHRGIAYERRKQYEQAVADFSKAVEINPRHGAAYAARARIYLKTDQRMLALRDAERAVSIDPFDKGFLDTRARVYEALGPTREATADYKRVLSSTPPSAYAARKAKRSAKKHHNAAQPRDSKQEIECDAARHADPAGDYAGYPCWARAVLGPGNRGTKGR
jgi:tetratricopeptide (TPR) repeat protein